MMTTTPTLTEESTKILINEIVDRYGYAVFNGTTFEGMRGLTIAWQRPDGRSAGTMNVWCDLETDRIVFGGLGDDARGIVWAVSAMRDVVAGRYW